MHPQFNSYFHSFLPQTVLPNLVFICSLFLQSHLPSQYFSDIPLLTLYTSFSLISLTFFYPFFIIY